MRRWKEWLPERRIYYSGIAMLAGALMLALHHVDVAILNVLVAIWIKIK